MPKTVVIVGGGFAGVDCARGLERKLPSDWQIVLFNTENHTTFTPLLAEVVGSSISPVHVVWTIRQTLRRTVCYKADVSAFDFAAQEVEYKLFGGRIGRQKYDHLVIACGMVVNADIMPGAATQAFALKTLGDGLVLRNHLISQLERAEVEPDADQRRHLVTFAVLGGGFSGVEVAGEIFDLLTEALRFYRSLRRSDLKVTVIQGGESDPARTPREAGRICPPAIDGPRHRDSLVDASQGRHEGGRASFRTEPKCGPERSSARSAIRRIRSWPPPACRSSEGGSAPTPTCG